MNSRYLILFFLLTSALMPNSQACHFRVHTKQIKPIPIFNPSDSLREVKVFYKSGQLKELAHYMHGLKEGLATGYYPNGDIFSEILYKAGRRNGLCKWYGRKSMWQIEYLDGVRNGNWRWFKKGHLFIEANFTMNTLDGWCYEYYPTGEVLLKCAYKNGILLTTEDYFDKDGVMRHRYFPLLNKNILAIKDYYDKKGTVIKTIVIHQPATMDDFFKHELYVDQL